MATINMVLGTLANTHPSAHANVFQRGFTPVVVNFAEVAAAKGSALVAGDVIRVQYVPSNSLVSVGTLGIRTAPGADTTTCTLSVGTENSTANRFVDAYNYKTATSGAVTGGTGGSALIVNTAVDYITLTITALTGALTTGIVVVGAEFLDISGRTTNAGLATRT